MSLFNKTRKSFWLLVIPVVIILSSCGYQLVREKGIYGGEITTLSVPIFKNKTYEPHAPLHVTEAFSRELVTMGVFRINQENSDAYLEGVIKTIKITPSSLNKEGVVIEKEITTEVELALYRNSGVLVKRWTLTEPEIYRVDNLDFEDHNKREALRRASARMARRFAALLLVNY